MPDKKPTKSKLPPLSVWEPEMLRLTLFPNKEALLNVDEFDNQTWWKDIFGMRPTRTERAPNNLFYREEGRLEKDKDQWILVLQRNRIDWQYVIDLEKEKEEGNDAPFTLGKFPFIIEEFLKPMKQWLTLQTCPSASRLAFGAILLQRVKNLQDGYSQIANYLHDNVKIDPGNISDFMYRINKPRPSKENPDLKFNRLSTWSVAGFAKFQSTISGMELIQHLLPEKFACRLELDISTNAEYKAGFTKDELFAIFDKLIGLGTEIAQEGDIK